MYRFNISKRILKLTHNVLLNRLNYSKQSLSNSVNDIKDHEVDALVIGGGAVGVSAAYHLAKYGVGKVILLEKSDLTSGSTWHAAGLVTTFNTSINAKKINLYSVNLYKQLEEETGQNVGFHLPGSLRILTSPTRMDEARYHMTRQYWNPAEQFLVDPDRVMQLCPILNPQDILGGIYNTGDGHIDPYSLTQALASGARKYGAKLLQRTPVTSVNLRSDDRWDVASSAGSFICRHLINASGFYAEEVSRMCGIKHYVPIVPVHHQYFITKPLDEVKALNKEFPVIRDLEGSYYMRQEKQSLLVGPYETSDRMDTCDDWVNNGPPDFQKELFPDNLERIMPNSEMAMYRVPCLANTEISTVINGPITYNCQNSPMLGPVEGLPNFWQMVGFGYGIAQAGGAGHFIASWIKNNEPPHESIDIDADRWGRWCSKKFALAKARESYGMNNFPTYPKEERWAGRPSDRCGPLYHKQLQQGAQMGFVSGWEKPLYYAKEPSEFSGVKLSFRRSNWFSAMQREVYNVLNNVSMIDLTPFAKYVVEGECASEFLDKITANNLPKLGSTCISHMLTASGRVFAELTITHLVPGSRYLVVTGASSEFHDLCWMQTQRRNLGYKASSVQLINVTDQIGVLGIAGPRSRDLLESITSEDLSSAKFKFLQYRPTHIFDIPVDIIRISYTGELGWEIYCPMNRLLELYNKLYDHGKSFELSGFGSIAMNSLRIEKGFRMWSADMTMDTNPIEAGLGFFIKPNKSSDFIGKQAIKNILSNPLKRQLVFIHLQTDDVDADGDETVFLDDQIVGSVTSGSYGCQVKQSIAMAYIRPELAIENQPITVELLGHRYPGLVHLKPPVEIHSMRERKQQV